MALEDTAAVDERVKEGDAEVRRRLFVLQEPGGEIGTSRAPVGRGRFVDGGLERGESSAEGGGRRVGGKGIRARKRRCSVAMERLHNKRTRCFPGEGVNAIDR